MNKLSGNPHGNLSVGAGSAESETARLAARARVMMVISALTTVIAIAAVVAVIGYRVFAAGGSSTGLPVDATASLPKGARVVSTSASAGRVVVLLDIGGTSELRIFDIKTLKQTGRVRFATEP
jgi:hypothetical protein